LKLISKSDTKLFLLTVLVTALLLVYGLPTFLWPLEFCTGRVNPRGYRYRARICGAGAGTRRVMRAGLG